MKIYIGPYKKWWGPYQVAGLLEYIGFSEEFCDWLGEKLPLAPFEWIGSKRNRKIKIKIHEYDTWSMDHTLAMIIHPMLVQLQATKHGAPSVDDADVPEELRSTASTTPKENEWDSDEFYFKRWDWALDEMIWSFQQEIDEDIDMEMFNTLSREDYNKYIERIGNGYKLFGKYYRGLWD